MGKVRFSRHKRPKNERTSPIFTTKTRNVRHRSFRKGHFFGAHLNSYDEVFFFEIFKVFAPDVGRSVFVQR